MRGREGLGRSTKHFFELTTEVRFAGELKFSCCRFVGVTLGNELFSQSTLKITQPTARSAMQVLAEEPLQLSLRDGTKRGHFGGAKISLSSDLFPLFDC